MAVLDAQGATFTFNDRTTAQTVGGVVSFSGFDGETSEQDVTTLSSTAKEYRLGLQDFGNFSLELMRDPNDVGQAAMEAAKAAGAVRECVLTLASGNIATFNALVKGINMSGGVDAQVTGSANLRITGAVVWT
ncbi:MAG: phage tail tube protein [Motiliproteus sp.]|nr:phage tail tube protein [Motiliproteus sp.]